MTDRFKGLHVVLETDLRDEDAEPIIAAIKMLKGVVNVSGELVNANDFLNRERIRREYITKLWNVLEVM